MTEEGLLLGTNDKLVWDQIQKKCGFVLVTEVRVKEESSLTELANQLQQSATITGASALELRHEWLDSFSNWILSIAPADGTFTSEQVRKQFTEQWAVANTNLAIEREKYALRKHEVGSILNTLADEGKIEKCNATTYRLIK